MKTRRVLIVDADMEFASQIQKTLADLGYGVLSPVATGEAAVQFALDKHPDLVLMETHLSAALEGIVAAVKIKEQQDIPVVFLSAHADKPTLEAARKAGAYGYLVKPVTEESLFAALETAYYKHLIDREVQENRERCRSVLTQTLESIFLVNAETGMLLDANPAFERLAGFSHQEIPALSIFNLIENGYRDLRKFMELCVRKGAFHLGEWQIIKKSGGRVDVDLNAAALQYEAETILSFIAHDVTERKIMEKALKASEERFRAFFENMRDGVLVSQFGMILQTNQRLAEILGMETARELVGKNVFDYLTEESSQRAAETMRSFHADESESEAGVLTLVRADGSHVICELSMTHLDLQGEKIGLSVVRDMTERIQLEQQLCQAKLDWEETFDAVKDMVILTDNDGRVTRCNRITTENLKQSFKDIIGKPIGTLFWGSETNAPNLMSLSGEMQFPLLEGWFEVSSFRFDQEAEESKNVFIIRDITLRKKVLSHLMETNKFYSLGTLAAGIAHEMNTPLQVITGAAEGLIERTKSGTLGLDRLLHNLERINENAWRMAEIVHSLVAYTRTTTEQVEICNINNLILDTVQFLKHELLEHPKVEIITCLNENLPLIYCDPNKINQVLFHLISNAQESMPAGGTITIRSDLEADQIVLEVEDTGTGIAEEIRDKIFDPFFTTRQFGDGMGLGLSVVLGIVKAHGGKVSFENGEKQGTVFRLVFPQRPPVNDTPLDNGRMGRFSE